MAPPPFKSHPPNAVTPRSRGRRARSPPPASTGSSATAGRCGRRTRCWLHKPATPEPQNLGVPPKSPCGGALSPPPPHAHSGVWECLKPPYTHPKTCPWWRMEWFLYGFNKVAAQWFLGCRHVPFRGEFGGTPPPSPPPPCDFGGRGGPPPSAPRGHKALQVAVSVGEVGREGGLEGNPMFIRDGLGGGG